MATLHKLAPLPYAYDTLEPHIDAKTMEIHYSKHHQTYVDNLNKALTDPAAKEFADMGLEELLYNLQNIPAPVQTAIRNNGGGHFNHTIFWSVLTPKQSSAKPIGHSAKAIDAAFGSFEKFQEEWSKAALGRFGSGWVWLLIGVDGQLKLSQTAYQDNPLMDGLVGVSGLPILGLDVWEHAYYLKHQNRRADYVKTFWSVVNWDQVEFYFGMALKAMSGSGCCGGGCGCSEEEDKESKGGCCGGGAGSCGCGH